MEYVFVFADIGFGEASVGHPSRDFVWTIEGEGYAFFAKLLLPFCTILAVLTGFHNASNSNQVSNLKSRNLISNSSHSPENFMTRNEWEYCVSSIIFDSVKIGMTDSTVEHFKCDILRSECSTSNFQGFHGLIESLGSKGFYLHRL
jgi:hypothetical protein